jgi:hypothetical protein
MYPNLRPLPLALAVADKAVFNFSNQWLAGLQPRLLRETGPDGQIWVTSQVVAGDVPTHSKLILRRHAEEAEDRVNHCQAGEAGHHRRPHRHGPSRQRRLLRREAARAAAAAETADRAVENAEPAGKTADTAGNVPPSAEKVAQSPNHPPRPQVAAAEAVPPVLQPNHQHDQNFRSVLDELCPDGVYIAAEQAAHPPQPPQPQNIPQLDGQENVDREWWCYCCRYAKLFQTEELLHQHHDTTPDHMLTYEECNICYPWHVWT